MTMKRVKCENRWPEEHCPRASTMTGYETPCSPLLWLCTSSPLFTQQIVRRHFVPLIYAGPPAPSFCPEPFSLDQEISGLLHTAYCILNITPYCILHAPPQLVFTVALNSHEMRTLFLKAMNFPLTDA